MLLEVSLASLLFAYAATGGAPSPRSLLVPSSPLRRTLLALSAGEGLRLALGGVLRAAREAGRVPYAGWERAAFHAEQGLLLLWPFAVLRAVASYYAPEGVTSLVAVSYAAAVAHAAAAYPALRGEALADYYRSVQLACALACVVALAAPKPRLWRPSADHLAAALLPAGLAAELAGPYLFRAPTAWWTTQVSWTLTFAAVCTIRLWGGRWIRNST